MGNEPTHNNTVSVPIAWATFGGSTCLLFLLCYICQKKLQEKELQADGSQQQVYVISPIQRPCSPTDPIRQAPPDYESALCQKGLPIEQPPSYETAVAIKYSHNYSLTL